MSTVVDAYWATPAIARTVATVIFICSVGVHTEMLSSGPFWFHWRFLYKFPPALYRLVTSFLITGPQIGVLLDTYFVYSYLSQLEKGNSKFSRKEDLIWYLMVVGSVIIWIASTAIAVPGIEEDHPCIAAGPSFANLNKGPVAMWAWWDVYMDDLSKVFGRCLLRWFLAPYISMLSICVSLPLHVSMCQLVADIRHQLLDQVFLGIGHYLPALLIAICYTATQDQRGQTAHFYVVTIPAQLMPYALLLLNLLNGWMMVYLGLCGLLAAHFHDFCTRLYPEFGGGPNLLPTPWFISWLISTPRVSNTSYGSSYAPPRDDKPRSGPLPDSWRSAGPGRRLG